MKPIQKTIPRVTTTELRLLKQSELRKVAHELYFQHCSGKEIKNIHLGIPIKFMPFAGRKTAHGEAVYSKKVAVIPILPKLIELATYNNFGQRKETDPLRIVGYLNFKAFVFIDDKKECLRIAVQFCKDGSFYYSIEVNKKK